MFSLPPMPKWLMFIPFNNSQLQEAYGCVLVGGVCETQVWAARCWDSRGACVVLRGDELVVVVQLKGFHA